MVIEDDIYLYANEKSNCPTISFSICIGRIDVECFNVGMHQYVT